MKTQETDRAGKQKTSSQKKGNIWGRSIGGLIVVALIISASVLVFTQLERYSGKSTQQAASGKWVEVLNGYNVTSLIAAPSNSSVLYACASHGGYTLLRSTDGGTHWQEVGKNVGILGSCQLAINPVNSNDLYIVTRSETPPNKSIFSEVLKHSADGGQTWTTIVPKLSLPGLSSPVEWNVQRLTMQGKRLFGLQLIPLGTLQRQPGGTLPVQFALSRLLSSADGGQIWTVLDEQFQAANLEVRSYAVDPSNANTLYELVGRLLSGTVPGGSQLAPTSTPFAAPSGANGDLYKSTDAGAHWQLVLKDLPFGSEVQFAPGQSARLYAGGTVRPLPAAANRSGSSFQGSSLSSLDDVGSFHLHVSSDGGITWQEIPSLPAGTFIQTWYVGRGGEVFGLSDGSARKNTIRSYDPASKTWSEINPPQPSGSLLAVTTTKTAGGIALWFQSSVGGQVVLYRYLRDKST